MKKLSFILWFLLLYSTVCCGSMGVRQLSSDRDFFDVLNLDYPGLEQVKRSAERGDYATAKHQFVTYLKQRKKPLWYFDWHEEGPQTKSFAPGQKPLTITYADRYVKNNLLAHGTWHQFGDKIDWTSNHSVGNDYDEWTWQLNRHIVWETLSAAYQMTGDEKYAKAFVRQMNDWVNKCKIPVIRWNGSGSAWRTFETGFRLQENWPNAFFRFLNSPNFDDESIIKMLMSFYDHAKHLRNHSTGNNWLAVEMNGLYTVGALFPEFKEAEEWRTFAANTLFDEELKQFYPDGAQKELAPGYHALSQSSIVSVYKLATLNGYHLPKGFIPRLEKIFEYYINLRMPDGKLPALNDSKWVEADQYIKQAAELFPNREDFQYFATGGKQGRKPKYTSLWMPWAGWYVMRSGWDEDAMYAFFEVGPYGAAHQHEDKLSFILYAYGQQLITECGTYSYDNSDERKYTISARGHNVARVDGMDQNRNALRDKDKIKYSQEPLTNTWISTRRYDYGEGGYTEGYGARQDKTVTHKRSVKFVKNKYWIVTDTFTPTDDKMHTYDTWFHFNTPSYAIDENNGIVYTNAKDSANVAIIRLTGKELPTVLIGQENPELQGWIPVAGGGEHGYHCRPVATPLYHAEGKGMVKEIYLFIPYKTGESMPVKEVTHLSESKYKVYLLDGKKYTVTI